MNQQLFLQQSSKEDFAKVVTFLHKSYNQNDYKQSRVQREEVVKEVFNVSKTDENFEEKRYALELIARASKTDWGQELYKEITGVDGFLQATAINKKSYYEAVVGIGLEKYNPRSYEDILKLSERAIPNIVENPHSSAEEISSRMSRQFGYVVGSILPSIGTIRALYNKQVNELVESLSAKILEEKQYIFAGKKEEFLNVVSKEFENATKEYSAKEVATIVANKLHGK